jgi:hypothetical protein
LSVVEHGPLQPRAAFFQAGHFFGAGSVVIQFEIQELMDGGQVWHDERAEHETGGYQSGHGGHGDRGSYSDFFFALKRAVTAVGQGKCWRYYRTIPT